MNRLTDRSKEIPLPCADNAAFWARVHEKLARYEDTNLEPEVDILIGGMETMKEFIAVSDIFDSLQRIKENIGGKDAEHESFQIWEIENWIDSLPVACFEEERKHEQIDNQKQ